MMVYNNYMYLMDWCWTTVYTSESLFVLLWDENGLFHKHLADSHLRLTIPLNINDSFFPFRGTENKPTHTNTLLCHPCLAFCPLSPFYSCPSVFSSFCQPISLIVYICLSFYSLHLSPHATGLFSFTFSHSVRLDLSSVPLYCCFCWCVTTKEGDSTAMLVALWCCITTCVNQAEVF